MNLVTGSLHHISVCVELKQSQILRFAVLSEEQTWRVQHISHTFIQNQHLSISESIARDPNPQPSSSAALQELQQPRHQSSSSSPGSTRVSAACSSLLARLLALPLRECRAALFIIVTDQYFIDIWSDYDSHATHLISGPLHAELLWLI